MQSENQSVEREPTEEEIKHYRDAMTKFYSNEIPFLKKRKEYEQLLADIEEAKAKRLTMTYRIAQIMAPPQEEVPDQHQDEKTGADHDVDQVQEKNRSRKLKTEKA